MSKITLATYLLANLFAILIPISASAKTDPMPDFIAGKTFTAVAIQYDQQHWHADFSFANKVDPKKPSKMVMYTVACEADLFAVAVKADSVLFKTRITKGKNICTDNSYVKVTYNQGLMMPTLSYSNLYIMQPVVSQGILQLKDNPNQETDVPALLQFTQQYLGTEATVLGSWVLAKGLNSHLLPKCHEKMPRDEQNQAWLPQDARGTLTIWGVPSESGGKLFAVYITGAEDVTYKPILKWTELKHFSGATFAAAQGIDLYGVQEINSYVYLYQKKNKKINGQDILRIVPKGSSSEFAGETFIRCPLEHS
ncbi:MAG: hypothetical protein H6995_02115 [Pseudomonadales bacterium]|nr:hypothetical protein [Pseudomonadales bacterium]MCP5213786.1 hypothetical protein [Pseudomonadales bacterium]